MTETELHNKNKYPQVTLVIEGEDEFDTLITNMNNLNVNKNIEFQSYNNMQESNYIKNISIPESFYKEYQFEPKNNADLTIENINARIKEEICYNTLEELSDSKLMCEYKNCNSVKNEIKKLGDVLEKYTDEETKQKILEEYLLHLIPAGTKGVIRGNKFNTIVKQFITNLTLDPGRFEICFEKKCEQHFTTEIPDWYILEKSTNKIIIGMNQLDLWGGGQQINRGSKYIENNKHNNSNSKLLCVVCNKIQFKSNKNKAYKIFETGFKNNTLCYLNNLQNIITSYFN